MSSPQPPQANYNTAVLSFSDKAFLLSCLNLPCSTLSLLELLLPIASKICLFSLCAAAFYIFENSCFQSGLLNHCDFFNLPLKAELLNHCLFLELSSRLSLMALHLLGSIGPKAGHRVPPEGQYKSSQKACS